jgi:hypothetical protein
MNHTHSLDFRGDLAAAFTLGAATLTASGFKLVNKTARSLEFTRPGLWNSRESPLLGASRITITGGGGRIELAAELGGRRRNLAITILVVALCVVQAIVFGLQLLQSSHGVHWQSLMPVVAPLLFGALVGPIAIRFLRQRTIQALDTLLANMVMSGQDT